jgi:hypothetical protein
MGWGDSWGGALMTQRASVWACGVPPSDCSGGSGKLSCFITGKAKTHVTSEEAFACRKRFLQRRGFEQIGPREFRDVKAGGILILTKRSRFGCRLRPGKEDRHQPISGSGFIA